MCARRQHLCVWCMLYKALCTGMFGDRVDTHNTHSLHIHRLHWCTGSLSAAIIPYAPYTDLTTVLISS